MYRASRNSKFKLQKQQVAKRPEHVASIQEMSISLLNEIDRKYQEPKRSTTTSVPRKGKGISASVTSYLTNQSFETQPSVDRIYSYQKIKQNRKLQEIQQNYQNFREHYSTQKHSNADKENIHVNTDSTKSEDEINKIISCLEQRFIKERPSALNTPQHVEQQLKDVGSINNYEQTINQLQNRDASMRLDLAKYKKLNSELREKHSEALKQIAELEKIQKRVQNDSVKQDNEYIIRMDNNMMQMKQKLQQCMNTKHQESTHLTQYMKVERIQQLQSKLQELQDENAYLLQLLTQYQEKENQSSKQFNPSRIRLGTFEQPKAQNSKSKFIVKNSTFQSTNSDYDDQLVNSLWHPQEISQGDFTSPTEFIKGYQGTGLCLSTPSIKLNDILKQGSSIHQNTSTNQTNNFVEPEELDMTIQSFMAQLDEDQAEQIHQMFNEIIDESHQNGEQLSKNQIYEKLAEKIVAMKRLSDRFVPSNRSSEKRIAEPSSNSYHCASQMSNFSFAQNSERRRYMKQDRYEENESGIDPQMMQQILSLNAQIAKQVNLQNLSQEQANHIITYLQDQITNSSTQAQSEPNESQYRQQLASDPDMEDKL